MRELPEIHKEMMLYTTEKNTHLIFVSRLFNLDIFPSLRLFVNAVPSIDVVCVFCFTLVVIIPLLSLYRSA